MPANDDKKPGKVDAAQPQLSDEDRKHFATEVLKRLKQIPDQDQQTWYFALLSAALDHTNRDIDKSLAAADKAFAEKTPTPTADKKPTETKAPATLGRLKLQQV